MHWNTHFDIIESSSGGESPNINRYLTRTIQMDLCTNSTQTFTFAKLGPIAILARFASALPRGRARGFKQTRGLWEAVGSTYFQGRFGLT